MTQLSLIKSVPLKFCPLIIKVTGMYVRKRESEFQILFFRGEKLASRGASSNFRLFCEKCTFLDKIIFYKFRKVLCLLQYCIKAANKSQF